MAEQVTNIISSVGFPIFCVIALGYFIYKAWDNITKSNKEREDKLYEIIGKTQQQLSELQDTNKSFVAVLDSFKSDLTTIKSDVDDIKEKMNDGK